MAERATLARPYARAAFEYAQASNNFAGWSQLLAGASAVVGDPQVAGLLSNPKVAPTQLVDFVVDVLGGKLDEPARNFLSTLAENHRLSVLPEITSAYEELRSAQENVADVQITSAIQLNDAQRQRLADALRKRLKREVRLHCDVDPTLIGGAVIRSGDLVIDGSLKAQLDRLTALATH
jgi:F-type H+-transporting ATPase subunit delta